jgi:hypothetical protein
VRFAQTESSRDRRIGRHLRGVVELQRLDVLDVDHAAAVEYQRRDAGAIGRFARDVRGRAPENTTVSLPAPPSMVALLPALSA